MAKSMSNNSPGTMKSVRRVNNRSDSSSKSLGLCGANVFSLVWLGDRLVGHLASTVIATKNSTMVGNKWSMSNKGSIVSNQGSMVSNKWSMMSHKGGMMKNRGMSNYSSWSIAWNAFIGDILDISRVSFSVIVDNLGSSIRKSNPVAS